MNMSTVTKMHHIKILIDKLWWQFSRDIVTDIPMEVVKTDGYKTDNTFPTENWQKADKDAVYNGYDDHYWFRTSFKTPECSDKNKYIMLTLKTGKEGGWNGNNPQGLLYLNGKMVQGFDTNHSDAYLEYGKTYDAHLYFYLGMYVNTKIEDVVCNFRIREIDKRIEKLFYDLKVPYEVCMLLDENDDNYIRVSNILERTINMLDMRSVYSEEYYESIQKASKFLEDELYNKLCSTDGKPIVNCIGHTHIDVEWLWTRFQTKEKIQHSFASAKALMDHFPEYKFMLSQPENYRYLKEEAPEKYEELKELVKNGRWEPEGAMYVEADCNLISGESFVRQILVGKRFFKDEFGVDCKILMLPDVFGYSAALPQILKKSGVRHFVTSKISWNDTNKMPVDTFLWQGIDGTEIFTNFITTQSYKDTNFCTTYVGMLNPSEIKGSWDRHGQKDYVNRAFTTFGIGDGGGGPTKEMLENYRRLEKGIPGMPVTKMEFLLSHLDKVREEFDESCKNLKNTPKWVGELYLEYHRGTYTSMAKNKRFNRLSEFALSKAEALSYTDKLLLGGNYDTDGLNSTWLKVLHNQFHDIIPGSSIKQVYEITDKDYDQILDYTSKLNQEKLSAIAKNLNTKGGIMVYNPLGFERKGIIKLDGTTYETKDAILPFGWSVTNDFVDECKVKVDGLVAENNYYRLNLDKTGAIISLYDKRAGREVFKTGARGNELQVFEDFPKDYDNWEISYYYKQKMWLIDHAEIEAIFDGTRAGFSVKKKYMNSTISQNIWLYTENERIDFETEIDWHEQHQILKASFPLDINTMSSTYEIQYGHVTRPNHENTSWDKAKFEVYGHKWVDMGENGYGVALLNDCKYGHNTEGSTLKLTILKAGVNPNPIADQGKHVLTYSLLPHQNDFREAGVINEAYSLNQPLDVIKADANDGKLPQNYSLISTDKKNVIIETVKKAEDSDAMIVRMYEAFGRRANAKVTVADGFKKAYLCDLLENEVQELEFDGKNVAIPVSNFEIITLKFER